jgi:hypothetical protein
MSYLVLNKDSNYPIPLENWIRSKKYYNLFPVEGMSHTVFRDENAVEIKG